MASGVKPTFKKVSSWFTENKAILLTKEYINQNQALAFTCECGRESEIAYRNRYLSKNSKPICEICRGRKKPKGNLGVFNPKKVINWFLKYGCIPLFTEVEYTNQHQKLPFICKCGKRSVASYDKVYKKQQVDYPQCEICRRKQHIKALKGKPYFKFRFSISELFRMFQTKGAMLLTKELLGKNQILEFLCSCGEKGEIAYPTLLKWPNLNLKCRKCRRNYLKGNKHPNYNLKLTESERKKERKKESSPRFFNENLV